MLTLTLKDDLDLMSAKVSALRRFAVLGTSPLMIILASVLRERGDVHVYEPRRTIGGAWSHRRVKGMWTNSKTNVIFPMNEEEERQITQINTLLRERFNVIVTACRDPITLASGYTPKHAYHYDLSPMFEFASSTDVIRTRVDSISLSDGRAYIGNREYERVYVPYFASLEHIRLPDGAVVETPYTEIRSEHLLSMVEGVSVESARYCELFNDVFDRVQIRELMGKFVFTGRVARPHKGKPLDWLSQQAQLVFPGGRLVHVSLEKYKNSYRTAGQIEALVGALSMSPRLAAVDTSQFVSGFLALERKLQDEGVILTA